MTGKVNVAVAIKINKDVNTISLPVRYPTDKELKSENFVNTT